MTGKQLKDSILQLAIQGKLVPQDANDEPAYKLVKRLRTKKYELVNNKIILKKAETKPFLSQDSLDELCIPKSWEWVQLSDVSIIQEGAGIRKWQYRDKGTQVLCVTNILEGSINLHNKYLYISNDEFKEKYSHLKLNYGDIVTACSGGSWGKTAIFDSEESVMLNTSTLRLRFFDDIANNKFLYHITKSSFFKKQLEEQLSGMQPNFGYAHYSRIIIPLPPLSEQHRIVAKIEELMPLVEEYDKAQTQLDELNGKLPEALKKSILQEAIMGKLVPQDPNDEPASKLLERIRKEKEQLVKEGKLKKKDLATTPITDEEKPFEIPESWEWCRLGEIGSWGSGATPAKSKPEYYTNGNIPWLRTGELNNGYVYDSEIKVTQAALENCSLRMCHKGDVLIAMYGATIGKVAIAGIELTTNQACCACTPIQIYNEYLMWYLMASKQTFIELGEGGAQPNISREKIVAFPFALPPLSEQKRIVEKIEQLFAALDAMKM